MIDSRIAIGLIAVLIGMATLAWAGINERDRMAEFEESQHAKAIQTGAKLFEDNCSECHGDAGEGVQGRGPTLKRADLFNGDYFDEISFQGTVESFVQLTVAGGRPVKSANASTNFAQPMPTWSQQFGGPMRPDQVRDVVAFVLNWEAEAESGLDVTGGSAALEEALNSDDPAVRGGALFNQNGCSACHTVAGYSNGAVGPELTNTYQEQGEEHIRESILMPNAVIADSFQPDIMPANFGQLLTPEQLDDIVAFLQAASN